MKQIVESQPARKKIWWLLLLVPILYVAVDNLIYPIDESALFKRTTNETVQPGAEPHMDTIEESEEYIPPESVEELTGWDIYDRVWVRVDRAWPMVLSLLAFVFRKRLVGDPK